MGIAETRVELIGTVKSWLADYIMKRIFIVIFLAAVIAINAEEEYNDQNEDLIEGERNNIEYVISSGFCMVKGSRAVGKQMRQGTIRTSSAGQCAKKCTQTKGCKSITWCNDKKSKRRFRRRCYFLKKVKETKKKRTSWWGPVSMDKCN